MSERRKQFPFDQFEPKWQAHWDVNKSFKTPNPGDADFDPTKPKYYVLDMFPYPSGAGLHVGHPEGYTATDIIARHRRMTGHNVLHPMGWDAFGLPAEQHAIKTGEHPRINTEQNTDNFRRQLKRLGFSYDWEREVNTTDPAYVRWTQWIFLQLYGSYFCDEENKAKPVSELEAKGWDRDQIDAVRLAYVDEVPVNWSPSLGTVLANEEVEEWKAKGETVERRPLKQWMLRITAYAQRLIDELDGLDWPDGIKLHQRNWIGRSDGAEVDFMIGDHKVTVFTTRPDTLFGATYMVLAPEHQLVDQITTGENAATVAEYKASIAGKSDLDRGELNKDKSGVFTGATATNPVNGEEIPVWIADYVMMGYGTGAIMAVPGHDERDYEFAEKFDLPILQVVADAKLGEERGRLARFFDKHEEINTTTHRLSHWQQDDTAVFVTWRLADSLPKDKLEALDAERQAWMLQNPEPWNNQQEKEYHQKFSDRINDFLNQGAGCCCLSDPALAKIVADALSHFDGKRYQLHAAVVMPNHVHVLFSPTKGEELSDILHSWKSFTAKKIQDARGLEGRLWQPDYFDRLIRSSEHFAKVQDYILKNPAEAGLKDEQFLLISSDAGGTPALPFCNEGTAINSGFLDGKSTKEAKAAMADWLAEKELGKKTINYKLRDWLFSRQRYWGEPFPIEWDADGKHRALPDEELPLLPPPLDDYKPTGSPEPLLSKATEWVDRGEGVMRETNTMPQWAGSCWYYLRYADAVNPDAFIGDDAESYWMGADSGKPGGVDLYIGGTEHAVLHLLYARFWHKVLHDLGHVSTIEPFQKLVNQGLIMGEDGRKMSKSIGNVVNPDDVVDEYGADSLRLYEMFMGPLEQVKPWSMKGVEGVYRFLARVWRLAMDTDQAGEWVFAADRISDCQPDKATNRALHATIKKVGEDIDKLSFNTAISEMMKLTNVLTNVDTVPVVALADFLKILSPFAPHLAEELWSQIAAHHPEHCPGLAAEQDWPAFDESALVVDEVEIVVQVNGKLRDKITVGKDASKEEIETQALAAEKVIQHTEGKEIRKVIVVPGRLVNVVVG